MKGGSQRVILNLEQSTIVECKRWQFTSLVSTPVLLALTVGYQRIEAAHELNLEPVTQNGEYVRDESISCNTNLRLADLDLLQMMSRAQTDSMVSWLHIAFQRVSNLHGFVLCFCFRCAPREGPACITETAHG